MVRTRVFKVNRLDGKGHVWAVQTDFGGNVSISTCATRSYAREWAKNIREANRNAIL